MRMGPMDVSQNSEVYYHGDYWNDIDCTVRMINRRISGDDRTSWWRHFAARTGRVFDRALILNCGNGWVEREMLDAGFIKESVGGDLPPSLLDQPRSATGQRPAHYVEMNVNTDRFPELDFDLVVNHAAAHHVTRL